jgi:hypothetical protein
MPNTSYNHFVRTPWNTPSSVVNNACLLVRYLAIDVLLLLSAFVARMCLPTRRLAMGIHVTIHRVIPQLHGMVPNYLSTRMNFALLCLSRLTSTLRKSQFKLYKYQIWNPHGGWSWRHILGVSATWCRLQTWFLQRLKCLTYTVDSPRRFH